MEDSTVVRDTFETLTPKWQDVLWRIEVDDEPYVQLASRYRASPAAWPCWPCAPAGRWAAPTSPSTWRPRRGTDMSAVSAGNPDRSSSAWCATRRAGARRKLESHVVQCVACTDARDELGRLNRRLRSLPIAPTAGLGLLGVMSAFKEGIKAQLVHWWSASVPAASSGVTALAVIAPVVPAHTERAEPATADEAAVVAAVAPDAPDHATASSPAGPFIELVPPELADGAAGSEEGSPGFVRWS